VGQPRHTQLKPPRRLVGIPFDLSLIGCSQTKPPRRLIDLAKAQPRNDGLIAEKYILHPQLLFSVLCLECLELQLFFATLRPLIPLP
jgi:hypothetical protein